MVWHTHCFSHPRPKDGDCILRHYSFGKDKAGDWNARIDSPTEREQERAAAVAFIREGQRRKLQMARDCIRSGNEELALTYNRDASRDGQLSLAIERGEHVGKE